MAPSTPKADDQIAEAVEQAALSVDPLDSTYKLSDSDELKDQYPEHGQQVEQTRGEPQDHGKGKK